MTEIFETLMKFVFNNMRAIKPITDFESATVEMPQIFIEKSSKENENPLQFFQFLCSATKPMINKLNQNGDPRSIPLQLCMTKIIITHYCMKCGAHEENEETVAVVDLLPFLERE